MSQITTYAGVAHEYVPGEWHVTRGERTFAIQKREGGWLAEMWVGDDMEEFESIDVGTLREAKQEIETWCNRVGLTMPSVDL